MRPGAAAVPTIRPTAAVPSIHRPRSLARFFFLLSPAFSSLPVDYGSLACTSLLTAPKSISAASGCFFSAAITLPISFFDCAPVS